VVGRPRLQAFTRRQWWPVPGLAAVFPAMNISLYTTIDRIGLGLAVTLEFLGPLAVALGRGPHLDAPRRRRATLACALLAAASVVVLARPQPTTDDDLTDL
jgi:inner membrane transporter RhtA